MKIIKFLKNLWKGFARISSDKTFILSYPLVLLATIALCVKSILVFVAFGIWFVVVILNINEEW